MLAKFQLLLIILLFQGYNCLGQMLFKKTIKEIELRVNASTSGMNPFWIRSNQYGKIPQQSNSVFFAGGILTEYDSTYTIKRKLKKFDLGYGVYAVGNIGKVNTLVLPEAYIKSRLGIFELSIGRRKQIYGLVDSTLTSGSYIWSGNSLPLPRIQISIPNYASILGKGLISIKGSFSHGWFGIQTYTKNYYLHEKSLYGKIGRNNWKINFLAGINNQVQWGGYSETLKNEHSTTVNGFMSSDFNSFLSAAFPLPFIRKKFPPEYSLAFDDLNYGGNVLGSVDFGLNIKVKKNIIKFYRQIPYDLGSLFTSLVNADDGLYGINLDLSHIKGIIKKITLEGFNSFNQGAYRAGIARLVGLKDQHGGELHGYLNHGQYIEGWSYQGKGMGTPILMGNNEINSAEYKNSFWRERSSYNQAKALFLGLNANYNKSYFQLKTSVSQHRLSGGSKVNPNPLIGQFSIALKYEKHIMKYTTTYANIGYDSNGLLEKSFGINIGIRKRWM